MTVAPPKPNLMDLNPQALHYEEKMEVLCLLPYCFHPEAAQWGKVGPAPLALIARDLGIKLYAASKHVNGPLKSFGARTANLHGERVAYILGGQTESTRRACQMYWNGVYEAELPVTSMVQEHPTPDKGFVSLTPPELTGEIQRALLAREMSAGTDPAHQAREKPRRNMKAKV